jgi:hypothetical protein
MAGSIFINEYQQNIGEKNRKYATIGDSLRLPAGVYSVYIIAWGKRETMEHHWLSVWWRNSS